MRTLWILMMMIVFHLAAAKHPLNDRIQQAVESELTLEDQNGMRQIADTLLGGHPEPGKLVGRIIRGDYAGIFVGGLISLMESALDAGEHPLYTQYYLGDEDDSTNYDGQQGLDRFREMYELHIGRLCERVDLLLAGLVSEFWSEFGEKREHLLDQFDQTSLDWINYWKVANVAHQEEAVRRAHNFVSMGIRSVRLRLSSEEIAKRWIKQ